MHPPCCMCAEARLILPDAVQALSCCPKPNLMPLVASSTLGSPGSPSDGAAASCLSSLADASLPGASGPVYDRIRYLPCVIKA